MIWPKSKWIGAALFTLAAMFLYCYGFVRFNVAPAEQYAGRSVYLTGQVAEVSAGTNAFVLKAKTPAGQSIKVQIWCESDDLPLPDQSFTGSVTLLPIYSSDRFDSESYYRSRGIFMQGELGANARFGEVSPSFPASFLRNLRQGLCERIVKYLPKEAGGFVCAVVLGERAYLSQETKDGFDALGISHLLAVSGMHLVVLTAFFGALARRIFRKNWAMSLANILFVLFYMFLTGAPPSIVRAGVMLILSVLAGLVGRESDALTSIAVAVCVMIYFNPFMAAHIGFCLSVAATIGVRVLATPMAEKILSRFRVPAPAWTKRLIQAFSVSFCAYICTLPVTALSFSRTPVLAIPANLVLPVLFVPVFSVCALAVCLAPVPVVGALVFPAARFAAGVFLKITGFAASLGAGFIPLSSAGAKISVWIWVGFLLWFVFSKKARRILPAVTLAVALCCTSITASALTNAGQVQCYAAAYGKNVLYIQSYAGHSIVVGNFTSQAQMAQAALVLTEHGTDNIDLLILLSGGGRPRLSFSALTKDFSVGAVAYLADENISQQAYESLAGIPFLPLENLKLRLGSATGVIAGEDGSVAVFAGEKKLLILPYGCAILNIGPVRWDLVLTSYDTPPAVQADILLCGQNFWGKQNQNPHAYLLRYGRGAHFRLAAKA